MAESVTTGKVPDIFNRVELWKVCWQGQQRYVRRHDQALGMSVLANAVDLHQTMGVRCDVAARSCERPILPLAP